VNKNEIPAVQRFQARKSFFLAKVKDIFSQGERYFWLG
jgi:hypothetical protein